MAKNNKKKRQKVSKILTSKQVNPRHAVREVAGFDFDLIERIYADAGVVRVLLKDGDSRVMTIKDAAIRAHQINLMPLPEWHHRQRNELVRQIIDSCREAQRQIETDDPRAKQLANLMDGKDSQGNVPFRSEDQEIQFHMLTYPYLTEDDVRTILREPGLNDQQKGMLLSHENAGRMAEAMEKGELTIVKPAE
jgi:hypothetical protein